MILEKRLHRTYDRRIDRGARVVVEIDAAHGQDTKSFSTSATMARGASSRSAIRLTHQNYR